jgi:hypothetical protein
MMNPQQGTLLPRHDLLPKRKEPKRGLSSNLLKLTFHIAVTSRDMSVSELLRLKEELQKEHHPGGSAASFGFNRV